MLRTMEPAMTEVACIGLTPFNIFSKNSRFCFMCCSMSDAGVSPRLASLLFDIRRGGRGR